MENTIEDDSMRAGAGAAPQSRTRARTCAMVGLSVALITVCAWVTVPIGPVPLTLQMFAIPFILCVVSRKEAILAVAAYLALGAAGVPVFSGMHGGIGILLGPTGGYLWGYLPGVALAALFLHACAPRARREGASPVADPAARARMGGWQRFWTALKPCAAEVVAGLIFTVVAYLTAWIQYALVAGMDPVAAFMLAVAPFIAVDAAKVVAAVLCAQPVKMHVARR